MTPDDPKSLPSTDFSMLVLSFAHSAMVHLGVVPGPDGSTQEPELAVAHQTIDTLEMLQHKTRNNLTDDEAKLLQTLLYELRMTYVKATGKPA